MQNSGSTEEQIGAVTAGPDLLTDDLRFRRAMEIDTVGIVISDRQGEIRRANDAFLRMCGYTQDDLCAGHFRTLSLTAPEWQDAAVNARKQLRTSGATAPYEKQYLRNDGTRFWALVAAKALSDEESIAFVLDITERKEAEARLQDARERLQSNESELQTITDSIPALIAYVDTRLCYLRVNRAYATYFDTTPEALIGRAMSDVLGTAFPEILTHIERALAGEAQQFEVTLTATFGTRQMLAHHIPDRGPDGQIRGVVIHSHDITERKQTEELLRTAEKLAAVGRLAASMAHEINNPLESVTNLLYLARTCDDAESRQTYLFQAESELRRVSAITNQTLRFHKQSTRPISVTADDLFDSVLTIYSGRLNNVSVQVNRRVRTRRAVLCFDGEIRQVLSNLLSNALDAMTGRDALLTLCACEATHWPTGRHGLRLTIADTGVGMSAATLARIWEPFFTTKDIGGTGLGLWISLDIAERHAGTLRVRSRHNVGTVFSLWLPFDAVVR